MEKFYSNGKLLISGEYLVLDGAASLALPTKFGQFLEVEFNNSKTIAWKSYNIAGECWFQTELNLEDFKIINHNNEKVANTLKEILATARVLNPNFLVNATGLNVQTNLTFPNEWGLGTSSTLINNIAQWANINGFELLEKSFGGSGYDIACAQYNQPITYQRDGIFPIVDEIDFSPNFKNQIFFVYLNQKQDSKEGIKMYRSLELDKTPLIKQINKLTQDMIQTQTLEEFERLVKDHETLIARILSIEPVKQKLFSDFKGAVKSLGAWGGDFVLVTGTKEYVYSYFKNKGYTTILGYDEMILN